MGGTTAAGTRLAISVAAPASQTVAGYEALTYTTISGLSSIGGFGPTTGVVPFQPLDGPEQKHKGPTSYGSLNPPMLQDDADAGQNILLAASEPDNNALYSFKVTKPDGALRFFQARVFGMPETIGEAASMITAAPTIEINTKVFKKAAA